MKLCWFWTSNGKWVTINLPVPKLSTMYYSLTYDPSSSANKIKENIFNVKFPLLTYSHLYVCVGWWSVYQDDTSYSRSKAGKIFFCFLTKIVGSSTTHIDFSLLHQTIWSRKMSLVGIRMQSWFSCVLTNWFWFLFSAVYSYPAASILFLA